MDDKALREYIEKELDRGFSKENITKVLLEVGYSDEKIELAFKAMNEKDNIYNLLKKEASDSSVRRYAAYAVISAFLIGVSVYFLFFADIYVVEIREDHPIIEENNSLEFFTPSIKEQLKDRAESLTDLSEFIDFSDNVPNQGEPDRFYSKISQEQLDCMYENDVSSRMCKAVVLEDVNECSNIKKISEEKACHDMVFLKKALDDSQQCSKMNVLPEELCNIVSSEKSEECENLDNEDLKKTCTDIIELKKGIESKDSSICERSDVIDSSLCLAMTKDDVSYCNSILSRTC